MKVCPRCGSSAESKFCPECGFDLSVAVEDCKETHMTGNEPVEEVSESTFVDIETTEVNHDEENFNFGAVASEFLTETEFEEKGESAEEGPKDSFPIEVAAGKTKERFYEKTWFIILMLFLFFPVGAYLMWKKRKFSKIVRVIVSVILGINFLWWTLVFVIAAWPCSHEWEPATCTAPATCSKCEKTEGEALGHSEGDWKAESVDGVNATISYSKKCTVCDKTVDTKTQDLDTLVSGDAFYMTPSEFVERFDNRLDTLDGNNLNAVEGDSDGKFACGILVDGEKVGAILFTDGDTAISKYEDDDDCIIQSMLGSIEGDDNTARVLVALIETCDPSLSFEDARTLAKEVAKSGEETKNGITYLFLEASDGTILGVTVE